MGRWKWYFSPTVERIYELDEGNWSFWIPMRTQQRRQYLQFKQQGEITNPAQNIVQTSIHCREPYIHLLSWANQLNEGSTHAELATVIAQLYSVDITQRWSTQQITCSSNDGAGLAESILLSSAMGVSNRSFKVQYGTAAWIIQSTVNSSFLTSKLVVPGDSTIQSVYRSEFAGLYGMIMAVQGLCDQYAIKAGSITMTCNGQTALDYAFDWENKWITKFHTTRKPYFGHTHTSAGILNPMVLSACQRASRQLYRTIRQMGNNECSGGQASQRTPDLRTGKQYPSRPRYCTQAMVLLER